MPRDDYQERRQARIDRLHQRADNTASAANQAYETARKMASVIPLGQPILVGHHSEKRDRNYRKRIWKKQDQSCALSAKAKRLAERATAAENNTAISSDDPEAVQRLKEKLESLETHQSRMKAINAAFRKAKKPGPNDEPGIVKFAETANISLDKARLLVDGVEHGYSWEKQPYPGYTLTNNNANIRRVRDRIKQLTREATIEHKEVDHEVATIVHNTELNRVQIIFNGKPSAEIRKILKSHGFRWSRQETAWQRLLNSSGIHSADWVVEAIKKLS